ncbi:MAG: hypothetical protein Q9186_007619 [Xanthomendoza sp. 1 TL-2023]
MARNNKVKVDGISIELAGSHDEKYARSLKTNLFQWQAVTAAVCLVSRSLLLYFWIKFTTKWLREDTYPLLDPANIVAYKLRVSVLDDSNSNSASEAVTALKTRFPNIFYTARRGRKEGWHKAGNINHGLKPVASLPGGPYELVAALDGDMIPEKDWLRRLAPHFCLNLNLGLVGANQRFYNVPRGDPLGQLL